MLPDLSLTKALLGINDNGITRQDFTGRRAQAPFLNDVDFVADHTGTIAAIDDGPQRRPTSPVLHGTRFPLTLLTRQFSAPRLPPVSITS